MQQSGIVPTNENTYQLKHIDKAVESALTNGRTIKVHCLKDAKVFSFKLLVNCFCSSNLGIAAESWPLGLTENIHFVSLGIIGWKEEV